MSNNDNAIAKLIELQKENTLSTTSLIKSMGFLDTELKNLKSSQDEIYKKIEEQSTRMQRYEDDMPLTSSMRKKIPVAVKMRTAKLLKLQYNHNGYLTPESMIISRRYRGEFIRHCYHDCKSNGRMAACYSDTAKRDFDSVIEDINNWVPSGGVEALKQQIDLYLETEKEDNKGKKIK